MRVELEPGEANASPELRIAMPPSEPATGVLPGSPHRTIAWARSFVFVVTPDHQDQADCHEQRWLPPSRLSVGLEEVDGSPSQHECSENVEHNVRFDSHVKLLVRERTGGALCSMLLYYFYIVLSISQCKSVR